MNPEPPHVTSLDDLPDDSATGTVLFVDSENRLFIFDGFKWWAEGDDGNRIAFHPQQVEDTGFTHCPKCVGVRVLTSIPPQVKYECEVCGGGVEVLPDLTMMQVAPNPLFAERTDVLAEAYEVIHGERAQRYGDAFDGFHRIAALWSGYLGTPVNVTDVANLMILLKVSRARNRFHRDSYVDIAGYAALAEKLLPGELD